MSACRIYRTQRISFAYVHLRGFRAPRLVVALLIASSLASTGCPPQSCTVPDNGMGTADLPPTCGTSFIGPIDVPQITDGLPPGSTINLQDATIVSLVRHPITPGGSLGGDHQATDATMAITLRGTGSLAGYHHAIQIPLTVKIDAGVRPYGASLQSFPVDVTALTGQASDADFDLLRITGGSLSGYPSSGHVDLNQQPGGQWSVYATFDVSYRVEYIGAPAGPLAGRSGSEVWQKHLQIGIPPAPQETICPPGDINGDRHLDGADIQKYVEIFITGPSHPKFCSVDANANGVADTQEIVRFTNALIDWPSPAPVGSSYWDVPAACDNRHVVIMTCGPGPIEYRAVRATDADGNPSTCTVQFQLETCDGVGDGQPVTLQSGATGCATVPNNRQLAVWCVPTPGGVCRICAKSTNPCP